MARYKPEQGRMARLAVFWSLAVLIFYGCYSLRAELAGTWAALRAPIGDIVIPVLGIELSPAFLIVTAIFGTGLFLLYRWLEKPKNADLLIDTEGELKKVTWPTGPEVVNSSMIVIVSVLIIMGFLALADFVIGRIAGRLLGIS